MRQPTCFPGADGQEDQARGKYCWTCRIHVNLTDFSVRTGNDRGADDSEEETEEARSARLLTQEPIHTQNAKQAQYVDK